MDLKSKSDVANVVVTIIETDIFKVWIIIVKYDRTACHQYQWYLNPGDDVTFNRTSGPNLWVTFYLNTEKDQIFKTELPIGCLIWQCFYMISLSSHIRYNSKKERIGAIK